MLPSRTVAIEPHPYLFYKRLDRRTFRLPEATGDGQSVVELDERAFDDLLDGIDLEVPPMRRRAPVRRRRVMTH